MHGLFGLAAATLAALVSQTVAFPLESRLVAVAGSIKGLQITNKNTLNGTAIFTEAAVAATFNPIKITLKNNFAGKQLNAYITGKDSNNAVVMLKADGTWYRPNPNGSTSPVKIDASNKLAIPLGARGSSIDITLPNAMASGRVWVSEGELTFYTLVDGGGQVQMVQPSFASTADPSANVNWGFIELTATADSTVWANLSYVDFVGLVMAMSLNTTDGQVQTVPGLKAGSIASICADLKTQAALDGQPWDKMCVTDTAGNPLRVLSPNIYADVNRAAMVTYYDNYISQVWAKYTSSDLNIDLQDTSLGTNGKSACRATGSVLTCAGSDHTYAKPALTDILGCNTGPFVVGSGNIIHQRIVPRLCAAFNRATLLMSGGNVQPGLSADNYYKVDASTPANHYSRIVHAYEAGNRGYAFSYDDVNPVAGVDQSGLLVGVAKQLTITIGGA